MHYLKEPKATSTPDRDEVATTAAAIIQDIELGGIEAVRRHSERLDRWNPPSFRVSQETIERAEATVSGDTLEQLDFALERVRAFAELQRGCLLPLEQEVLPGVTLGHRLVPVGSVGSYVPGGRYPLIASALMTIAVPKVAGVRRVIACAPPKDSLGIDPVQLVAMHRAGADAIYCVGGVQALAAMVFGPSEFEPVDMLVGAGNVYVAEAKRQLFGRVGIDLLAGPTELLVIADESASPEIVAADLLGQAEHGPTSETVLVTTSTGLATAVLDQIDQLLPTWPTRDVAGLAWRERGAIVICDDDEEAVRVADAIASEHVEVQTTDPSWYLNRLSNYGTLFLGDEATVVYSDKAIGTNHVLPTGRAARYTGGLWVGTFIRTLTYQAVTPEGTTVVAPAAAAIAESEGMRGHAITARMRLDRLAQPV